MSKKLIKLIFLLVLVIFFASKNLNIIQAETEQILNAEINQLNNQIQTQKDYLKKIQKKQQEYSKAIKEKQNDKASLENQLSILENRIEKAKLDIEAVKIEIDQLELEIQKVKAEIKNKNDKITTEKEHIANILKMMHVQNQTNSLEIILMNESLADFLNQMSYLEDINKEIRDSLNTLKDYKKQLEKQEVKLSEKNDELMTTKQKLEEKKQALENEVKSKVLVLEQVKESEKEYQSLLAAAKREQANASADIAGMEREMRAKIEALNSKSGQKLEMNPNGFIWPVTKNTITATFHDPDYPFRYIFEHPGIDIRAAQGTQLKAVASGYIARSKVGGPSYGYIMIIHGDGLSSVYGHASKSYVKEDEYVQQGQVIGLSGGMPGTQGAGNLTTGPHLHFEIRKDGIPVNPLGYLP